MSNRKSVVLSNENIAMIKEALSLKILVLEDIVRVDVRRSYKGPMHDADVAELARYKSAMQAIERA